MQKKILSSWKEIALYLGRSTRTVQRWERELGLPVCRPSEKESSSIYAFMEQIDA
jgi:DNA-binding transcriptional regulator YiaG